jgi:signal peptidase
MRPRLLMPVDRAGDELTSLRRERDLLRQEVLALRTQLEAAEGRLAERASFTAKVDELAEIARSLSAGSAPARVAVPAGSHAPARRNPLRLPSRQAPDASPIPVLPPRLPEAPADTAERVTAIERPWVNWVMRGGVVAGVLAVVAILALTLGPRFLPYQTYVVLSGSMEPTIPTGAVIVLDPVVADGLSIGDVITFQRPDRPSELVTHRIVDVEQGPTGRSFVTKGDANTAPDGWRIPATGSGWRYRFAIPYAGYGLRTVQSVEGRLLLVVVPALALAGYFLVELWRPRPATAER